MPLRIPEVMNRCNGTHLVRSSVINRNERQCMPRTSCAVGPPKPDLPGAAPGRCAISLFKNFRILMDHFCGRRQSVARLVLVGRLGSEMGIFLATDYRVSLLDDPIVDLKSFNFIGGLASLDRPVERQAKGRPLCPSASGNFPWGQPDKPSPVSFAAPSVSDYTGSWKMLLHQTASAQGEARGRSRESLYAKQRQLRAKGSCEVRGLAAESFTAVDRQRWDSSRPRRVDRSTSVRTDGTRGVWHSDPQKGLEPPDTHVSKKSKFRLAQMEEAAD